MPETILKDDLSSFLSRSYIQYAMSVITDRALPDIRDGLKPVHRAGLYSMFELNLVPNGEFKKGASTVGHALGLYYPHGDTSIYDAVVGLSQDFNMRYPLVQAHGNNGNTDNDPHAAMRYLELKLSPFGQKLMADLNKDICDMQDNFDASCKWPIYFGTLIPNILANAQEGIAVGMACKTVPHNLTEIYNALLMVVKIYIDKCDAGENCFDANIDPVMESYSIHDLIKVLKGPDFPQGGSIIGTQGIIDYYTTGKGQIVLRSKYVVEENKNHTLIALTELPYKVNKAKLIERIKMLSETTIKEIKDVTDESDKKRDCVHIIVRKEANINTVLAKLYKQSDFQVNVNVNNNILNNGIPRVHSMKQILRAFIMHSYDVIYRRTQFEINKMVDRINYLAILIWAIEHSEEIVPIIRESVASDDLHEDLLKIDTELTPEQTSTIGSIQLKQLSLRNREKFQEEYDKLMDEVEKQAELLKTPAKLFEAMQQEFEALRNKFGDERRTELLPAEGSFSTEDYIEEEILIVTYSSDNLIKTVAEEELRETKRGTKGTKSGIKEDESLKFMLNVKNKDTLYFFTSLGKCHMLKAYTIPKMNRQAKGRSIHNFLTLEKEEEIVSIMSASSLQEQTLVLVTKQGVIKKLNLEKLRFRGNLTRVITFKDNDTLVSASLASDNQEFVMCTHFGLAIRFNLENVRASGKTAAGVIGMKFKKKDDYVVTATPVIENQKLLTVTSKGFAKQLEFSNIRLLSRGSKGGTCHNITEKTGPLISVLTLSENDELIIATQSGKMLRIDSNQVKTFGKGASGVKLVNLEDTDNIMAISINTKVEEEL